MAGGIQYNQEVHLGEIVSHNLGKASTGTPQIILRVKILGIPNADGSYEPFERQHQNERTIFISLTEKTVEFVIPQLEVMGFNGSSIDQLDPDNPHAVNLAGNQVELYCKHEKDQKGEPRERWNISNPREIITEKLSSKEVRQLDSLFGKALKKSGTQQRTATKPNQNVKTQPISAPSGDGDPGIADDDIPGNTEITDDDIPF